MPSILTMPALGLGFQTGSNTLLGQGSLGNDKLGATSSGLQRTANFFSGGNDVINALIQQLPANPQAGLLLTSGAQGGIPSPAGAVGVGPSGGLAGGQGVQKATFGTENR